MKKCLLLSLLCLSMSAWSSVKDCKGEISQSDKNECMLMERNMAVGRVMTEVTKKCAQKQEVRESEGGSIYPMLLDECMTKELDDMAKQEKKSSLQHSLR